MGMKQGRDALRRIGYEQVWRWPASARLALAVTAVLVAVAEWAKRGPVVGLLALVAFGAMAAGAVAGERWVQWLRRHRGASNVLGALWCGLLSFLALAVITNWSLRLCAFQAVITEFGLACAIAWRLYWRGQPR